MSNDYLCFAIFDNIIKMTTLRCLFYGIQRTYYEREQVKFY